MQQQIQQQHNTTQYSKTQQHNAKGCNSGYSSDSTVDRAAKVAAAVLIERVGQAAWVAALTRREGST